MKHRTGKSTRRKPASAGTRPKPPLARLLALHPRVANLLYQMERDELRLSQHELEQSRERLSDLFDFAPVGYMTLDRNGCIRSINITASKLFGRDRIHLIGHPLLPVIAEPDRRIYLKTLSALRGGRQKVETDIRIERNGGDFLPVHMVSVASGAGDSNAVSFRMAIVDLTDRKKAEEALEEHVKLVGRLVKASLDIMATADSSTVLQRTADSARVLTNAIFGMAGYGFVNGSFEAEEWSHDPDSAPNVTDMARVRQCAGVFREIGAGDRRGVPPGDQARAPQPLRVRIDFPLPDDLLGAALHDSDGRPHGVILVRRRERRAFSAEDLALLEQLAAIASLAVRHIEARTRAERSDSETKALNATLEARVSQRTAQIRTLAQELSRAAERERSKLAQILHDHLQQLLVSARMHVEQLQRQIQDAGAGDLATHVLGLIEESIRECKSLVVDLSPPILREAGLTAALKWLGRWMHEKHGLSVTVHAGIEVAPDKEGVGALLFQTVRELLFNVTKHAGVAEATVTVDKLPDGKLTVAVNDEGVGFDPALIEGESSGAAFGLFNTRERIRLLGGELYIESAPGRGTSATLVVPAPRVREPAAGTPPAGAMRSVTGPTSRAAAQRTSTNNKIRVLLADDHRIMREGLAKLLRVESEMEVVGEAEDGLQAVNMTRELRPDVVIMDLSMPVMNGIEATQAISRECPGVKVIALSIYEEADRAASVFAAGAIGYVNKAEASSKLIAAIRGCIPARSHRR